MKNYQEFLSDFEKLIACESVQGEPEKGKPFGEGVSKAYETFKNICIKLGFKVTDYDGYMGEATVGEGEELGVIGHLDVVPVSGNWQTDPFKLTLKDGKFYGRGVMDDKGPLLVCLYALKEVVDEYKTLNRKVRFLFGTNEESGWGDVDHFKTVSHFPEEGFSPDGNFPVIYAEKGPNRIIFDIDYKGKFTCFSGGTAVNAVCDYATVKGTENKELLAKYGLTVKDGKIESVGKACHGSNPRGGKNAIKPLLEYVNELENGCFKDVIDYLFNDKLNIFGIGNETGYATISPDIIESTPTGIKLVCDFRVPAKMNLNDFLPLFDKTGLRYTAVKGRDPLFVDKDCDFVKKLLSAYNQATGENESALSIAGATYSSVFNKGVAFGPELHGDDGAIHQPNEYLPVSTLEVMFNVYKQAFVNLLTK